MRGWAAFAALAALGSAVIGAGVVGARAGTGAVGISAAFLGPAHSPESDPVRASTSSATPLASTAPLTSAVAAGAAPSGSDATPVTPESLPKGVSFRKTHTYNGAVVYVPEACQGPYDVVLHFHGAHPYVKDLVEKANLQAVVAVFNAGNGAERYARAFQAGGVLSSLLRQIEMAAGPRCGGGKSRRVALSAWSAGYGAVEKLVTRAEDRERVDAVLLADGLHAGFADRRKRKFAPDALQAFRDFGELAKQDQKLFAITHSTIATDGYASTTECSRLLLRELSIANEGPFTSGSYGSFSVAGSAGEDKAAHIAQFRQMDASLFSKLRARWSR